MWGFFGRVLQGSRVRQLLRGFGEIIIGNGYMKRNANQEYAYYRENELYYPYLHVMDDDVEEFLSGAVKMLTNAESCRPIPKFLHVGRTSFF